MNKYPVDHAQRERDTEREGTNSIFRPTARLYIVIYIYIIYRYYIYIYTYSDIYIDSDIYMYTYIYSDTYIYIPGPANEQKKNVVLVNDPVFRCF